MIANPQVAGSSPAVLPGQSVAQLVERRKCFGKSLSLLLVYRVYRVYRELVYPNSVASVNPVNPANYLSGGIYGK
jgi:hypothetical protein